MKFRRAVVEAPGVGATYESKKVIRNSFMNGFVNHRLGMITSVWTSVLVILFMSFGAHAQENEHEANILFKCHVFVMHDNLFDIDDSKDLHISSGIEDNNIEHDIQNIKRRFGVYKVHLKPNKHYLIHIEQDGYHTKTVAFSTFGAKAGSKYKVIADVYLKDLDQEIGENENYALTHIAYDKKSDYFKLGEKHKIQFEMLSAQAQY